jgi:hypothetical protein
VKCKWRQEECSWAYGSACSTEAREAGVEKIGHGCVQNGGG